MPDPERTVFVTVGTTSFDSLIWTVTKNETLKVLKKLGFSRILLQIGRGEFQPPTGDKEGVKVEFYRYKDNIIEDMKNADFVISHAGAGSVLEALEQGRPLLVVVNEDLMGNHQSELATQLQKDGHVFKCTCSTLKSVLESSDLKALRPMPPRQPEKFAAFLDKVMGVS